MADTPVSSTQTRLLNLLEKECDGTYSHAARLLSEMGLPGNGCPKGLTWRAVKKLSDEEYLSHFNLAEINKDVEVETTQEKIQREYRERKAREQADKLARQERRRLNDALYAKGYRWQKVDEEYLDGFAGWPSMLHQEGWHLYDKEGNEVTLSEAKKQIGWEEK